MRRKQLVARARARVLVRHLDRSARRVALSILIERARCPLVLTNPTSPPLELGRESSLSVGARRAITKQSFDVRVC